MKPKASTLSTLLDPEVKQALLRYCKRHGAKVRYVVEEAICDRLEDELDLEAYEQRKDEDTVSLETVMSARKRVRAKKVA